MSDLGLNTVNARPRVNPITQGGRVVVNGFKDERELAQRHAKEHRGAALYKGPLNDAHYTMSAGEIALTLKKASRSRALGTGNSTINAFSSLNGAGEYGLTREDYVETLDFGGIVQAESKQDSTNQSNDRQCVLVIGGLFTMVNTSTERINSGDLLYWDTPDPHLAAIDANPNIGDRPPDKILVLSRPYNVNEHGPTKRAVFTHLASYLKLPNASRDMAACARSQQSKLGHYACVFYHAIKMAVLIGTVVHTGNMNNNDYIVKTAKELGILSGDDEAQAERAHKFDKTFAQKVFALSLGTTGVPGAGSADSLMLSDGAQDANDFMGTDLKTLHQKQASTVDNLLIGLLGFKDFVGRRVFAKAVSSAVPGANLDVNIGSYSV